MALVIDTSTCDPVPRGRDMVTRFGGTDLNPGSCAFNNESNSFVEFYGNERDSVFLSALSSVMQKLEELGYSSWAQLGTYSPALFS